MVMRVLAALALLAVLTLPPVWATSVSPTAESGTGTEVSMLQPPEVPRAAYSSPADPFSEQQWTPPPDGPSVPTIQDGIGPGSALHQFSKAGGGAGYLCTAAFLLRDPSTARYYLATAGHCLVQDEEDPGAYSSAREPEKLMPEIEICVTGCIDNALGVGTYVTLTMSASYHPVLFAQSGGPGLDFGVIDLPPSVHSKMRPWMPQWTGPTGYSGATSGAMVHYGHGTYCCPLIGGAASRTPIDQGRTAVGGGSYAANAFQAFGQISGGDSGSAISHGAPDAGRGLAGTEALGVITHGGGVLVDTQMHAIVVGTDLAWGLDMVKQKTGKTLELVLQDDPLNAKPQLVYSVTIQAPAADGQVQAPSDVKVYGNATSNSGALPEGAKVQVSLDDATFAKAFDAEGTDAWHATWRIGAGTTGAHTIHARLVAADGTALATSSITVKVVKAPSSSGGSGSASQGSDPDSGEEPVEGWVEEPPAEEVPQDGQVPVKAAPKKSAAGVGPMLFAAVLVLAGVAARRKR